MTSTGAKSRLLSDRERLRGRTRWSMACRCPRMASYALRGTEPEEAPDRQRRLMARGKQIGRWMGERFAAKYGADQVILEKPVLWPNDGVPAGELHTDIFVIPERLAVEVKSSAHPDALIDSALLQLAGEVHFDPDADKGLLAIVDPNDLSEELLPFKLTAEWVERVEDTARQVVQAGVAGELPARVCAQPSDGIGRFCPFIDTCFADWEPPVTMVSDPKLRVAAVRAYEAKQVRNARRDEADQADEEYRARLEDLVDAGIDAGVDYQIGALKVRRTVVRGRVTYRVPAAIKCGAVSEEVLAPFAGP